MTNAITGPDIGAAATRVAEAMIAHTESFNTLDAAGGDGDMGTTLALVSRSILADREPYPDDVGLSLMRLAKVISKTSGSSLSAVIMTGLMAMSRATTGKRALEWSGFSVLLGEALATMQARSKAALGDKTVLDAVAAIVEATAQAGDGRAFGTAALSAVETAISEFHDRPAIIGRLRLEPSKGVGHHDPGMIALEKAVVAMIEPNQRYPRALAHE